MQGALCRIRIIAGAAVIATSVSFSSVALAHDEIESSVPEHQAQINEPITEVTINFGEPVDGVELGLRGPDDERIAGEVTVISDTEARLNFAKLTEEGQYIVQYIAEEDGHLVAGAISFTYGDRAGQGADAVIWIIFGVVAAAVLGVGAFFSFRRKNAPDGNTVPV
ncbi:MAG: copper resistance protein CopC [Actinomycetota bacterium]|jgi:methionine-rich copper-binding protein CopC|uniref:copper resistance CopC family protein n=1 Tax=uncultured Ilumatobacter sp. TaxID=879968 RepID=UPI00374F2969|nr:copper resistance protein CopC [Actinomycetota bacterium]